MPAPVVLDVDDAEVVERYLAAMHGAGRRTGRSTTQTARTCQAKISRAGGWGELTRAAQIDAVNTARSFTSWLMVTGQITVDAELLGDIGLRLGIAGRAFLADDYRWFSGICCRLGTSDADLASQWNILVKIAAITGARLQAVTDDHFLTARTALTADHVRRGRPSAARIISAHFHRLQLTLFQAGRITT